MYSNRIKVIILIISVVLTMFGTSYVEAAPATVLENFGDDNGAGVGSNNTVVDPGYNPNLVPDGIAVKTQNIWATVAVLVQIAAVACVVFAGLRYMFASADQKADIKQGLIYLSIGAVLVFSAITIIQFVTEAAETIL